jgi:hypothetical protein
MAVAVTVAAVILAVRPWSGGGEAATPPPPATTAAALAATMNAALRATDAMTGRGTARARTSLGTQTYAFSFAATSRGDVRLETEWRMMRSATPATPHRRLLVVYNAAEHRLVRHAWTLAAVQQSSSGPGSPPPALTPLPKSRLSVQTAVPSLAVPTDSVLDVFAYGAFSAEFVASARAALDAEGDRPIAGGTVDGRPVWRTAVAIPWPSAPRGRVLARVALTVDQASGLTTGMTLLFADGGRIQVEYSTLDPDAVVPAATFDTTVPNGAATERRAPFRFVPLPQAETLAGVRALLPTFAFSGFSLSEVSVTETARQGSSGKATELWLVYRDGLESYRVRLQHTPFGVHPAWGDFAGLTVRDLDHGPFAGRPARTWVRGAAEGTLEFEGPGLFVDDGREVACFAGDLTPYEFWQAANSLQPYAH